MIRLTLALILLIACAPGITAQEDRTTGFMVHQLMICADSEMAEINRLDALSAPILDELVEEGMIRSWYSLRHAWGDEWNVGVVTVADSHRAWLDYWSEYLSRVSERHPALMADFQSHCTMHKDNMYSIRDSGTGS